MAAVDRFGKLQDLFERSLQIEPNSRSQFLQRACAGDSALYEEVLALLARAEEETDRLTKIVDRAAAQTAMPAGLAPEDRIGPYRVVREIGRGGMGTVFLAERDDAQFEQRVAIKTVRDAVFRPERIERFLAERRMLASLTHPNIAQLIDGGSTEAGIPYVVMEYVEGLPIDRYCDENALGIRERLELFCQVCDAVQAAHRSLIVHRDLKPSNIVVTSDGLPKLLDFGIAKLLEGPSESAQATRTEARLLTPEYASPEQIRGDLITTASDVYALGVLLYVLLTAHNPHRVGTTTTHEIEQAILGREPQLPSVATATATSEVKRPSATSIESKGWRKRLAGDLDNIALMALRKEPERRYASAAQLADDLRNHLRGLPVMARPDTLTYRWSKFVRRNRAVVLVALVAWIALVGGIISTTWFALSENRQRREAQRQASIAGAVIQFLNEDLLAQASPTHEPDREITLREVVDRAADTVGGRFDDRPVVRSAVLHTLAQTYEGLGNLDQAKAHYREALALRRASLGERDPQTVELFVGLAGILYQTGEFQEAAEIIEQTLNGHATQLDPDHRILLTAANTRADIYDALGDDQSVEAYEDAAARHRRVLGNEHPETLTAINNLAITYGEVARTDESIALLEEVLDARRRVLGGNHPDTVLSLASLGDSMRRKREFDRAEELFVEAIERGADVLGPDHLWHTNTLFLLGKLYVELDRASEGGPLLNQAYESQRRTLGPRHYLTVGTQLALGRYYTAIGDYRRADDTLREVVTIRTEDQGASHRWTLAAISYRGAALRQAGRCDRVAELFERPLALARESLAFPNPTLGGMLSRLGGCAVDQGHWTEAASLLEESYRNLAPTHGEQAQNSLEIAGLLAVVHDRLNQPEEAAQWRARAAPQN